MAHAAEHNGLDHSLPNISVLMEKRDTTNFPKNQLPPGYTLVPFRPTFAEQWVKLQVEVESFKTAQAARELFTREFLLGKSFGETRISGPGFDADRMETYPFYEEMCRRMVFIADQDGRLAATAALWQGDVFGVPAQRIHWVAVGPAHQGLGLSKVLVSRLMELYNQLGYHDYLYLVSQTQNYRALHVYMTFGFKPYLGPKPINWIADASEADYRSTTMTAWNLINQRIGASLARRPSC